MDITVNIGYGIAVKHEDVIKRGFLSHNALTDEIVDGLPFMSRLSNGDFSSDEETLVMAADYSVSTAYTPGSTHGEGPTVSAEHKQEMDVFFARLLPGVVPGVVVAITV